MHLTTLGFFYFVIITLFILKAVMDKNIYLAKFFVITFYSHQDQGRTQ